MICVPVTCGWSSRKKSGLQHGQADCRAGQNGRRQWASGKRTKQLQKKERRLTQDSPRSSRHKEAQADAPVALRIGGRAPIDAYRPNVASKEPGHTGFTGSAACASATAVANRARQRMVTRARKPGAKNARTPAIYRPRKYPTVTAQSKRCQLRTFPGVVARCFFLW